MRHRGQLHQCFLGRSDRTQAEQNFTLRLSRVVPKSGVGGGGDERVSNEFVAAEVTRLIHSCQSTRYRKKIGASSPRLLRANEFFFARSPLFLRRRDHREIVGAKGRRRQSILIPD